MKHLILMRHATAAPGAEDRARPLTPAGREEARRMGRALDALEAEGFRPAHALVSPALRAQETLAGVREALSGVEAGVPDEALYLAGPGQLLARLQALPEPSAQLLVVGHNPGLADLVDWLVGCAGPEARRRSARGLTPAACAALRIPCAQWRGLAPREAELVAFLRPADLA